MHGTANTPGIRRFQTAIRVMMAADTHPLTNLRRQVQSGAPLLSSSFVNGLTPRQPRLHRQRAHRRRTQRDGRDYAEDCLMQGFFPTWYSYFFPIHLTCNLVNATATLSFAHFYSNIVCPFTFFHCHCRGTAQIVDVAQYGCFVLLYL